jgi:PST family polysaccharide transporter
VSEALLRRQMRFRWLANRDLVTYAVGYGGIGITLAMLGWGPWALVAAQLSQVTLRTTLLLALHRPHLRHLGDWDALKDLMYFGGGFTLAKIANYIALQGDNLVVGRTLGPAALGFYGRAYQLMTAPAHGIGLVLDNVLFPAMAKVQDDQKRLTLSYRRGITLIALVVLPPSIIILVVAPEIVHVLLGARWASTVAPFQVLAAGMLFRTSYKMSDSLARSTGAVYRRAARQAWYAALVLVGAWVGQHWGILGVAWGVLFAVTANFLAMAQLSLGVTGMTWSAFWRAHQSATLLTFATLPIAWSVAQVARRAELPAIVVLLAVGAAVSGVGLAITWRYPMLFLGDDGIWMLKRLRGFLPARLLARAGFAVRA